MRKLDDALREIASRLLDEGTPAESDSFAEHERLKSKRNELVVNKKKVESIQLKARNRLEATQHSSALADMENQIQSIDVELDLAKIQIGRDAVMNSAGHSFGADIQKLITRARELANQLG